MNCLSRAKIGETELAPRLEDPTQLLNLTMTRTEEIIDLWRVPHGKVHSPQGL